MWHWGVNVADGTGTVTEKSGVSNGTPGVATATGDLPGFYSSQSNVAKTYGTFSLTTSGGWTYTLNDNNSTVQGLNTGQTRTETITVTGTSGTKTIDITIQGANDAAVITGTSTGSVTEKSGVNNGTAGTATATGDLNATDVDNPPADKFVAQPSVALLYGTFSMTNAGVWNYTLDDNNTHVQELNTGGTLTDSVTVTTADGTAKTITITINGANDAATISGTATGSVTEKSGVANGTAGVATANGTLSSSDIDNLATFTVQSNVAKNYGTFSIDSAGVWTYTLNDNNAAVQVLNTAARCTTCSRLRASTARRSRSTSRSTAPTTCPRSAARQQGR